MGKKLFSGIESLGFDFANELSIFEDKEKASVDTIEEETKVLKDKFSNMLYDKEISKCNCDLGKIVND